MTVNPTPPKKQLLTSQELAKKRSKDKRKMLIVGVNEYADPYNNLNGCVNDAIDVQNTMRILGFPTTRIKMLTNQRATKANIMKWLDWLVKDADPGDVLGFYFSGHGSYVTDINGDELNDNVDEVILPHDFDFDARTYITDDELHEKFTGATPEGVRCEIMLDSCHSGTGSRSAPMSARFGDGPVATARFLPPPPEYEAVYNNLLTSEINWNYIGKKGLEVSAGKQHNVGHYACEYYQVAWEMMVGGQVRGVFTQGQMAILRASNGNRNRLDVYNLLRNDFTRRRIQQTPVLDVVSEEQKFQYPFRRAHEDSPDEVANPAT